YKAVRDEHWKYIHYLDLPNADELYDFRNDPYELKNIVHDPSAAAPLAKMQNKLQQLLAKTGAK
ncbi:MAG TPA: sulfatase/phosphatase domain-containing protein, partial [Lacipirellulaceae bacterium]|nr:sulfatase/phosphatase domain-containing protein [Lacipirellulaceae bacterium]